MLEYFLVFFCNVIDIIKKLYLCLFENTRKCSNIPLYKYALMQKVNARLCEYMYAVMQKVIYLFYNFYLFRTKVGT
jgi:hypothetical protein